jgi:sulfur carrier protein
MSRRYDLDGFPDYPILASKVIFLICAIWDPTMLAMRIVINGEERTVGEGLTLVALVEQLGIKADRVAIELNRNIVRRDDWPQIALHDGDRLEVVHFVGGGLPASG